LAAFQRIIRQFIVLTINNRILLIRFIDLQPKMYVVSYSRAFVFDDKAMVSFIVFLNTSYDIGFISLVLIALYPFKLFLREPFLRFF